MKQQTNEPELLRIAEAFFNRARLSSQTLEEFIKRRLEPCPGGRLRKAEAYQAYLNYCTENRCEPVSAMIFAHGMKSRFKESRTPDFRFYKDIRLIPCLAKEPGSKQSGSDGKAAA
jgi:hypothetical protein